MVQPFKSTVGRNVSQFVEGKFFQVFRSEICSLQVGNFLRENDDHVPKFGGSNLQVAGCRSQVTGRRSLFHQNRKYPKHS